MKRFVLLNGAGNNCGDHLIFSRARFLFARCLPEASLCEISRLKPYSECELAQMRSADVVVIVGGPSVRNKSAESLGFAPLIANGRFAEIETPFVLMGGGSGGRIPFGHERLCPSVATAVFFDKLQKSPFFSGVRDFETLRMLRAVGVDNVRFSACPAAFPDKRENCVIRSAESPARTVVFSCGSPDGLDRYMLNQHLEVVAELKRAHPKASLLATFHHTLDAEVFRRAYCRAPPEGWLKLHEELERRDVRCVDISGDVEKMLAVYGDADLHVGYRVHGHVLMTSWGKPSVLIAEDGRGSGMAEVLGGRTYASWHRAGLLTRIVSKLVKGVPRRVFHGDIAERVVRSEPGAVAGADANVRERAMCEWFAQFS